MFAGPRSGLTLLQPNASPWTQSYGYDAAERLTSVVSPAGSFGYTYDSTRVALPGMLTLSNGATIATSYDFMAGLTNTTLRSSQQAVLNHHGYGYNAASQRTSVTNLAGNTVAYTYDRSGQLTQASGKEANGTTRLNEQFGYGYDDENQLITVIVTNGVNNSTLSRFAYDGFGRRRVRTECVWQNGGWATNALVRYVYDGMVVLQERDGNNLPTVTYTRGRDLSSSLQGAGGIGGLLALTLHSSLPTPHFFYHADGNGNVTCLINEKQAVVARYVYEPFGNVLSMSGSLADLNLYRFSSKEAHPVTGLVYYGFRFYDPNLQRWPNRDPITELGFLLQQTGRQLFQGSKSDSPPVGVEDDDPDVNQLLVGPGGLNAYGFNGNNAIIFVDYLGLAPFCVCVRAAGDHAWIVVTDLATGEVHSYGRYKVRYGKPPADHSGVHKDMVSDRTRKYDAQRCVTVQSFTPTVDSGYDLFNNNCATYAASEWKRASGESLAIRNTGWGHPDYDDPEKLVNSINKANAGKKKSEDCCGKAPTK